MDKKVLLYLAVAAHGTFIAVHKFQKRPFQIIPTLSGAVVFVPGDPGEPNSLLHLVREDQAGWRVGFLCEHKSEARTTDDETSFCAFLWS